MCQRIIRFCYRKIIDAASVSPWDKHVLDNSYTEFLLQAQLYNTAKKYNSFSEIVFHNPGADQLHYLVSASITGYIQQLNKLVPDIVNNLGKLFLQFTEFRFEIIQSAINDQSKHQVAIYFFSELLKWHDTVGNYLLVSKHNRDTDAAEVFTQLVQIQPFFSIYSLKYTNNE